MIAPVNRIIDSSVVDGPGNRTAIFFQGCNFNCWYCHNPETVHMCTHCGACVDHCPWKALHIEDHKVVFTPELCQQCDTCIKHCPHQASPRIVWMHVDDLAARVISNLPFIRGVTCSGGECTLQSKFIRELFAKLKDHGLTCLLDSNGGVLDFSQEPELMAVTDGVMLDIKATDPEIHLSLTGQPNTLVLQNAVYLASAGKLTEIRTVMTNEKLQNEQTVLAAGKLLAPYLKDQRIRYRLIRFRPNGVRESWRNLGTPTETEMQHLKDLAEESGFSDVIIT